MMAGSSCHQIGKPMNTVSKEEMSTPKGLTRGNSE
nr:MAG TPA: hypothetical protein [Caudoviricetes sp.]